jgi:hypothetical protein
MQIILKWDGGDDDAREHTHNRGATFCNGAAAEFCTRLVYTGAGHMLDPQIIAAPGFDEILTETVDAILTEFCAPAGPGCGE